MVTARPRPERSRSRLPATPPPSACRNDPHAHPGEGAAPLPRFVCMAALRHPLLILLLFGSLAFAAVPAFDLVWDDLHYLHPGSALARGSLVELVTANWSLEGPRSGYYRPVVTLSLAAETHLLGRTPAAYHLMNVVYHLGAALTLVWAARRLLASAAAAWRAGLFFVLPPIHTESVAWVSGRTDVIATLFFCLAVGCYTRAARRVSPLAPGGPPPPNPRLL